MSTNLQAAPARRTLSPKPVAAAQKSVRGVLVHSLKGSLFGLIPLTAFYVAHQVAGVVWAVIVGGILSVGVLPLEIRTTKAARWSWAGIAGVAFGGAFALLTQDPKLFFLRSVIADGAIGLAMLGSLVIGRPLISVFASWVVNIPEVYRRTSYYRWSFGVLTFVWGVVNLARAAGRGYLVVAGSLDQLVLVQILTGWPVFAALVAFSVWYPRLMVRRYVASIGGDMSKVDQFLLGGLEEGHEVELLLGAEE